MPQVSVVMPVYNGEQYLAEAIESVLAQSFTDYDFIIVDDGSEDNSAAIVRSFAARDRRIRLIQLERNVGHGGARNAGLAAARGEYVAGQDSDDISLPERLDKQARVLQANPDIGAVGVYARVVSADLQPIHDREPPERHAEIVLDHFIGMLSAPFQHATLMMRRSLVLEVGAYDESLRYSVDCDLMTRLLGRTQFANIPSCLYLYRRRADQLTSEYSERRVEDMQLVRQRRLALVWGEAPMDSLKRLTRVRPWSRLTYRERRAAKRDILRIIDSIIAAGWVEAADRPRLIAAMNRRLERVSPRLWQQWLHWYRFRIQRHLTSSAR